MFHEPASEESNDDPAAPYKTKIGIRLFILYALVYVGFILINLINPQIMDIILFGGLNLALIYGIGLILFAWILALIYNVLCTRKEEELEKLQSKGN